MILVSDIIARVISALDAEGSDRYKFERDFKPAINYSIEFWIAVMNRVLGTSKLSEENLRELTKTKVWQTSKYSRIHFDPADINEELWSVLSVSPEPTLDPPITPVVNPTPTNSVFIPDVTFVRSNFDAKRLTEEQWNRKDSNIFVAGNNEIATGSFKKYAYKNFSTIRPGSVAAEVVAEIEISPYLDNQLVAVQYLVYPAVITAEGDNILFPKTMINLLVQKTLNFISLKQGDGTNLYTITEREIVQLANAMS